MPHTIVLPLKLFMQCSFFTVIGTSIGCPTEQICLISHDDKNILLVDVQSHSCNVPLHPCLL